MAISSVLHTGLQGIQTGLNGVQKSAQTIATATTENNPASTERMTDALVELKLYEHEVKGSARVVQAADQMMGSLLDTFA